MADADNASDKPDSGGEAVAASAPKTGEGPTLAINIQYIKDFSFEAPSAPGIFAKIQQKQPNISVKVDVQARPIRSPAYEVSLQIQADCKVDDETVFVAELTYAGIFTVNASESALRPILLIECPRLLFPFARQILANTTMSGGFMPLMLGPVDFAQLYRQQLAREQANAGSSDTTDGAGADPQIETSTDSGSDGESKLNV